ncbi:MULTISPECIES: OmpA family protein [Olivibacter]|uniref:OmpA family protein n=1 Tax=Olivibacter jilunii TaxID=985016 RepID=A0ABW6AV90_9SPHI|nr:OmpA family protein [Olivibacter sp. UJ_SKK_5.1]MDX3913250.1 OmpA family protein [Pseudosphingobacterium sp.]
MNAFGIIRLSLGMSIYLVGLGVGSSAQAQSLFKKIKNRVEQTATEKVLNKADKVVGEGVDKAIDGTSVKGNTKVLAEKPEASLTQVTPDSTTFIKAFAKYDFVPGDSIIYAADFADDVNGELPSGWNSNAGSVLVKLNQIPGNWLRLAQRSVCLSSNDQLLGPDFTVEFDLLMQFDLKGWLPPSFRFGLLASGNVSSTDNTLLNDPKGVKSFYTELAPLADCANIALESYQAYTRYFHSMPKKHTELAQWYGKPVHIAIQGQKERLRIWLNGEKLYDVPKGIPGENEFNQVFFSLSSSPYKDEQVGVYISNVKIAKGMPDGRTKLQKEGKFSTTGILFSTGQATILPESEGVLKFIASILAEDQAAKIQVVGHTDAVGDDKSNQILSERRAEAVKRALTTRYGIAEISLQTSGKGESEPVADNQTVKGRTRNRRVEFIRIQ